MDETKMSQETAALQRARLHLRSGRRRLRQGKLAAGISTIYDALISAMRWYGLTHRSELGLTDCGGLDDDRRLFRLLVEAGVIDSAFDFDRLQSFMEKAVTRQPFAFAWPEELAAVEAQLALLGVLPFDETSLPPEDPATF
ncbi:MAG: hypothetical protein P8Y63_09720 [Deltaproteobacteria bacterium]|jgi:hypothetical protein